MKAPTVAAGLIVLAVAVVLSASRSTEAAEVEELLPVGRHLLQKPAPAPAPADAGATTGGTTGGGTTTGGKPAPAPAPADAGATTTGGTTAGATTTTGGAATAGATTAGATTAGTTTAGTTTAGTTTAGTPAATPTGAGDDEAADTEPAGFEDEEGADAEPAGFEDEAVDEEADLTTISLIGHCTDALTKLMKRKGDLLHSLGISTAGFGEEREMGESPKQLTPAQEKEVNQFLAQAKGLQQGISKMRKKRRALKAAKMKAAEVSDTHVVELGAAGVNRRLLQDEEAEDTQPAGFDDASEWEDEPAPPPVPAMTAEEEAISTPPPAPLVKPEPQPSANSDKYDMLLNKCTSNVATIAEDASYLLRGQNPPTDPPTQMPIAAVTTPPVSASPSTPVAAPTA